MNSKVLFTALLAIICFSLISCADKSDVTVVEKPDTGTSNTFYLGNQPPLVPSPLIKLPIRSIKPKGWLLKQLELQADGFHGNLGEISSYLKKENNAWLNPEGIGDRGWEEVPYWLKGYSNCAYLLGREDMIDEAKVWIEAALKSQKSDGWFGPDQNVRGTAASIKGRADLWPNMIMLFCLQDYYDCTGDQKVLKLMTDYFHYLETVPEGQFLLGYWPKMRGGDLLYSIYWLYNHTKEPWLLDVAKKVHRNTARWDTDVINWHNVNIAQGFGEPATYYMQSKDPNDLYAAERNWKKVRDIYGQVPGGMFGGDENCRQNYIGPRQAIETCGIAEEMLSDETLLRISGNLIWADRCENAAFNTYPAAFTKDYKALRYLTAPNQVLSDRHNKAPGVQNGGAMFLMNPHGHRCCQHNSLHAWPYFAQNLWFATPDNGLAAVLYSESEVAAKVGDGTEITFIEKTHYPFDEKIELVISTPKKVDFPLYLRIPGWCDNPSVKINGRRLQLQPKPLSFIKISRTWSNRDKLSLELPMKINVKVWTKNKDSISVNRGPLTYSLKIGERYERFRGTDKWPAWEIHPAGPWNYGLILDENNPADSLEVIKTDWPASNQPFVPDDVPVRLKAKAKKIPEWKLDHLGLVGQIQQSPALSAEPTETIILIPMGAARLRISAFPTVGTELNANKWIAPPEPMEPLPTKASHCFAGDTTNALSDNLIPKNSKDHSIPRFTWWDHTGTEEWVQYDFEQPKTISAVKVYWFDDTGIGQCRIPQSWKLLYDDNGKWKEVAAVDKYGTEIDKFNIVSFDPIRTKSLRLEVRLQPGFSGGILEWRIEE